MASPYLNSGEAIVLTTNRVVAEGVSYDVMLTSERIFLIDSGMARLEPRIIPLPAILAVQGGKTPAQEPVITLIFRARKDGTSPHPLNLLFSQGPGENRKPERDEWVRGVIRLSIHLQEKAREPERPIVKQPPREPGLRPTGRHGVAPDMLRPLSNVADHRGGSAPLTVLPEVVPGSGEIPASPPSVPEHDTGAGEEREEVPPAHLAPVRGNPLPPPPPPARVIIPQIIEELLPEKNKPVPEPREEQLPAPEAVIDKDALLRTIPKAVRPAIITEPQPAVPIPARKSVLEPVAPEPEVHEEKELPEILRALYTGPIPNGEEEPEDREKREEPEKDKPGEPDSAGTSAAEAAPETESVTVTPEPEQEALPVMPETEQVPVSEEECPFAETTGTPAGSEQPAHRWSELFLQKPEQPSDSAEAAPVMPMGASAGPEMADTGMPVPDQPGSPEDAESGGEEPARAAAEVPRDDQSLPAELPPVRHPIPPAREIHPAGRNLTYAAVLLIIIALVAAGVVLILTYSHGPADTLVTPPVPTAFQATTITSPSPAPSGIPEVATKDTTTQAPSPVSGLPPVSVPQEGVWVRITSAAEYYGSLGNTGSMRQVAGSGDSIHPIFWSDRPVLVQVRKKDNTGAALTVMVYRNSTVIATRSVTSPMGTVEILIDPRTALAPGLSPEDQGQQGYTGPAVPANT